MNGKVLRLVDTYLGTFFYLLTWFFLPFLSRSGQENINKNIAVVKLWAIGESVLMLPMIRTLHKKGYRITVICTKQNLPVFSDQPFISDIHVFNSESPLVVFRILRLRKNNFSAVIDSDPYTKGSAIISALLGTKRRIGFENRPLLYTEPVKIKENCHAVETFHALFNQLEKMPVPKMLIPIAVTEKDKKMAASFLSEGKNIIIHAGSAESSRSRRWPEENFAKLCKELAENYKAKIFLVGTKEEIAINNRILGLVGGSVVDLSGRLTLHQLAALLSLSDIVIANDSGPMHIAAAMDTPTIGLFGPNVPERFGPYGKKCIGLRKDSSYPCILPFRRKFPECIHAHMDNIQVSDVMNAAKKLL